MFGERDAAHTAVSSLVQDASSREPELPGERRTVTGGAFPPLPTETNSLSSNGFQNGTFLLDAVADDLTPADVFRRMRSEREPGPEGLWGQTGL